MKLTQGRIDHRAIFATPQAKDFDLVIGKRDHIERTGRLQSACNSTGHFHFRGNHHINWQLFTAKQAGPFRLQIGLASNTGDLGRYVEQRMRDLTGCHVDLVSKGHRNQHVGFFCACLLENIGV